MQQLTAIKAKALIQDLSGLRTIREEWFRQALEIALPILEQQERGNKATLTDEKREWLIDECKADMQRYTSNSPRYLVAQIALASLEACCIIPGQPTNQNGEQ